MSCLSDASPATHGLSHFKKRRSKRTRPGCCHWISSTTATACERDTPNAMKKSPFASTDSGAEPGNARKSVEASVETQDAVNALALHDCSMEGIPR